MVKPTRAEAVKESIARDEKNKVKPRDKKQSSQFDEVLKERANRLQQPSLMRQAITQAATEQGVRHAKKEDERGHEKKGRKEGEEKETQKSHEGDRKTDAKTAEQRVAAKKSLTDERGGGGRGRGGGYGGSSGRRQASFTRSKEALSKQGPAMLKAEFAKKLAARMKISGRVFSEMVLNQIVKYIKLGMTSEEEKELKMELSEKFFRGLRLKIVKKGKGRVSVHFLTPNSEARELFESGKQELSKALSNKGIDVEEITVT